MPTSWSTLSGNARRPHWALCLDGYWLPVCIWFKCRCFWIMCDTILAGIPQISFSIGKRVGQCPLYYVVVPFRNSGIEIYKCHQG